MKKSLIALAVFAAGCMPAPGASNTPEGGTPMPSSIVEPYLKIQAELYNDSVENVRANAGNLMDGLNLTPPEDVQVASCETTKRQWLQEGSTIANPYDGVSAPTCGSFR